jgi:hypothetical protein
MGHSNICLLVLHIEWKQYVAVSYEKWYDGCHTHTGNITQRTFLRDVITVNKAGLGKETSASAYSHGPGGLLDVGLDIGHGFVVVNVIEVSSA